MKLRYTPFHPLVHCSLILSSLVNWQVSQAEGGIVTDGSMGPGQPLPSIDNQVTIPQDLGTTQGHNLFHSFTDFNVNPGQKVTFTENSPNSLTNVIARVTGDSRSDINGTLSVTPGGQANFFLLNPNGILFGQGAVLDVQGAFHASTASQLNFADGKVFSAENPGISSLSSVEPASFGFLVSSVNNNGLLAVKDTTLAVKPGKSIDLVAGKIEVQNATLLAGQKDTETTTPVIDSGEVRLIGTQGANNNISVDQSTGALPLPAANPSQSNAGDINLQDSSIKTSGNSGGRISLWGKEVTIATTDTSKGINAVNTGSRSANAQGGIDMQAEHLKLEVITVRANANNSGKAGNIRLQTSQDMEVLKGGYILSAANNGSTGDTGSIALKVGRDLIIDGKDSPSGYTTDVTTKAIGNSTGKVGDVNVHAGRNVLLTNGGIITSIIGDEHQGNTGNVNLTAEKDLIIAGRVNPDGSSSRIATSAVAKSNGNVGNVTIRTGGTISISNTGYISSGSFNPKGHSGNVDIISKNDLQIAKGSSITIDVTSTGNIGSVSVTTDGNLTLDGNIAINAMNGDGNADSGSVTVKSKGNATIATNGSITSVTFANRNAANIEVNVGKNLFLEGSIASLATNVDGGSGTGNAANVKVHADGDVSLDGNSSHISSNVNEDGKGDTGNVVLSTGGKLKLDNNAYITTAPFNKAGRGGNIELNIDNDILISGQSNIGSFKLKDSNENRNEVNSGAVGDTHIISKGNLTIDNSFIRSGTQSLSPAGNIQLDVTGDISIKSGQINSSSSPSGTQTNVSGKAGNITINNQGDLVINGKDSVAAIISSTSGTGNGGNIEINSLGKVQIENISLISSSTSDSGKAGDVNIQANKLSIIGNSGIISESDNTNSSGKTGNINIIVDDTILMDRGGISIQNYAKLTDAIANEITPGNITISARDINMTASSITSRARGNVASGNIDINYAHWLTQEASPTKDKFSSIETIANSGNAGNITIKGGELYSLRNSSLNTTTDDGSGDGGNIHVTAALLLMDTASIQANANNGNGGDIQLNLKALVPSGDQDALQIGGNQVIWQAYIPTFNVIQAVSKTGVNGVPNITAPQLNLSGVLANLGSSLFDTSAISQEYCNLGAGSTLTRQGKGGLLPKGNDWLF